MAIPANLHHVVGHDLCSRAHDGIIVAKAHVLFLGDQRLEDADVPAYFWWAKANAALTQKWPSGDFSTWIDNQLHCRAYGITFRESDIEAMLPSGRTSKSKLNPAVGGNYASAARCVDELRHQLGCTKQEAAAHIARFCRARLIEARCGRFWCEVTDRYGANEEESSHVAIPAWFWEHCATGPDAILDWQSGTFAGRGRIDGDLHKVRIKGAEFDVSGIIELEAMLREQDNGDVQKPVPATGTRPDTPTEPGARGGRQKSEKWADWIAELVSYIHEEGIPNGSGAEGQDAVIGAVDERLAAQGFESLSRTTVQPVVRAALVRLRSAGN